MSLPSQPRRSTRFARTPRVLLSLLTLGLSVALTLLAATSSHASPDDDIVRELTIHYELDAKGDLHVTETYQWDFGDRDGLGFYRSLVYKMGYTPDPTKLRILDYGNYRVESPSGAPAQVWVDNRTDSEIVLAVGAPNGSSDTRTGVQSYVLSYDVRGTINAVRGQSTAQDADEFYYNVFANSPNRVDKVTITVSGPAEVIDVACYQGPAGSQDACDSFASQGQTATFTAEQLANREGLTIMAAFPSGTFSDPGPILIDRPVGARAGDFVADNWGWGAAIWAALLGLFSFIRVRRGRDQAFDDLPVGALPQPGFQYHARPLASQPPVTPREVPPEQLRPAEAIVIAEEDTSDKAFTATMIDLAVRGYFTIEPIELDDGNAEVGDWRLTRNAQARTSEDLLGFEKSVLNSLFDNGYQVRMSDLREGHTAAVSAFKSELGAHADQQGWFTSKGLVWGPKSVNLVTAFAILGLVLSGGLALLAVSIPSFAHLAPILAAIAGVLLLGLIAWLATAKAAHGRSGLGRAHYEQIRGFRDHLGSVEGHQLRWQTGDDIFSDYLPWAVSFDLTERWVGIFRELAAEGRYTTMPYWYGGDYRDFDRGFASLGDSVSGGLQESISYSPGSSGDSGSFSSGGGGFSGGGVGGGSFGGR